MYERERRLQTGLSWPAEFMQRGLDGLEGLLMSGATGRISEGDRGHARKELSTVTFDPEQSSAALISWLQSRRSDHYPRT